MKYLYETLIEYGDSDAYPFHMPGHKRRGNFVNPNQIDITEIDGFDNLHHAEGILREAQERAADLYGSSETHFLVNGSTCGILSAVSACTSKGGKLLMARNCHKAAFHGAFLNELEIVWLYPETELQYGINGGIKPAQVEQCLGKDRDIEAVLITSPTYDGVVSDVKEIARIAHKYGVPLIVDEAHGAHFGFHPGFPEGSVKLGADIVIHSLHKTLPSFTQTAVLHVNGRLADRERLTWYLGIFQSSSPSYILMAGMDSCIRKITEDGAGMFEALHRRLEGFYQNSVKWNRVKLAEIERSEASGIYDFDRSKLIFSVKGAGLDGRMLKEQLRKDHQLELEMAAGSYALALTSMMDTEEGFKRLSDAISEIDKNVKPDANKAFVLADTFSRNEVVCRISQAIGQKKEEILFAGSEGRVSAEFLYLYPPGIPLLVPGERISTGLKERIEDYKRRGFDIQGLRDYSGDKIQVLLKEQNNGRC